MKKTILSFFFIILVGIIAYSNTFNFPFIFDDEENVVNNPLIRTLDNFIFPAGGYKGYLPRSVGFFSFALNYHYGGLNVTGYHIVNLIIHISNAILVFFLVVLTSNTPYFRSQRSELGDQRSGVRGQDEVRTKKYAVNNQQSAAYSPIHNHYPYLIALFSALLFVSHPVQTQAVTYIVQRLTSLATMFYLLSVVMYVKARLLTTESVISRQQTVDSGQETGEERKQYTVSGKQSAAYHLPSIFLCFFLSLISAVLAMLTKEMSFTLPLVIVLYEFTFFRSSLKKKLLFVLPIVLTLIIIPLSIMGIDKPLSEILSDVSEMTRVQTEMSRLDYLFTQFRVIVTYIRLMFIPVNQSLDYDYPVYHSFFEPPVFLSFLMLLSIFGMGVYLMYKAQKCRSAEGQKSKKAKKQKSEEDNRKHTADIKQGTTCLPLVAVYYRLTAFGIFWFFITLSVESSIIPIVDVIFEQRVYLPSVGAFISISAGVFIITGKLRVRWPKINRLFISLLGAIVIILSLATYERNTVWRDNITLWQDVVTKNPNKARAHNNLGNAFRSKGQFDLAIEHIRIAASLWPNDEEVHSNLGTAYAAQGLTDMAIAEFLTAVSLKPDFVQAHYNLGKAYSSKGLTDMAIAEYLTAVSLKPDFVKAHYNLGLLYLEKGFKDMGQAELELVLRIKPDDYWARQILNSIISR